MSYGKTDVSACFIQYCYKRAITQRLKEKNKKIKLEKRSSAVPNIWYKNKETDTIWWKDDPTVIGVWIFSFDKTTEFNMFHDYPYKLTKEQKQIFDKENPEWADFFKDRK